MNEKEVHAKLRHIKKVISEAEQRAKEASTVRDNAFAELLSQMNQDHQKVVAIVRVARYEMIFKQLLGHRKELGD